MAARWRYDTQSWNRMREDQKREQREQRAKRRKQRKGEEWRSR